MPLMLMMIVFRCVAKKNYKNLDHIACTEIKKANLANCELFKYMMR